MQAFAIVGFCIVAAVVYGIAHDSVTTRVCIEYFTVFHPKVIDSDSPTLLALTWGVIATWWVGLGLGVPLALAARAGGRPKIALRALVKPILILLVIMAIGSLVMGCVGYLGTQSGWLRMPNLWDRLLPPDRHARFMADLWAHNAAYGLGALGGLVVIFGTWHKRGRLARSSETVS